MIRPLWTLGEILAATDGKLDDPSKPADGSEGVPPSACGAGPAGREAVISGISIDTRTLAAGDLFVPLTDARDGHDFVTAAFERGAAAALVRASYARKPGDGALVRVDDPLRALERIGIAARARLSDRARVIAVTGSAGKTGTKEMLRACLKVCAASPDRVHAPEKSFNNHWGVPLTLARMPADTEYAVFEIGMNHAGEIRPLTRMVRPHIAIVTNVLPVHVGNFEDGEIGVAKAKAEIFEGLEAGGTAIILRDSPHYERLRAGAEAHGARIKTFSSTLDQQDSDLRILSLGRDDQIASAQIVRVAFRNEQQESFRLGVLGEHIAQNALAVVLTIELLGHLNAENLSPLVNLSAPPGRGALLKFEAGRGNVLLIDESYNANPASMKAAIENTLGMTWATRHGATNPEFDRVVLVLGDMRELGAESINYHKGLKEQAERADLVLCCGQDMRHLYDLLPPEKRGAWAATSTELIPHVLATLAPGDAVMVKGSLGTRMAPIVEAIKKHFDGG